MTGPMQSENVAESFADGVAEGVGTTPGAGEAPAAAFFMPTVR